VQINGKSSEEAETEIVNIVESIELTFAIQLPGADKTKFSWDLPFSGFTCDEGTVLYVTKPSPWCNSGDRQPFDLLNAVVHLAFNPSDDFEADSYEPQLSDIRADNDAAIIKKLSGAAAVVKQVVLHEYRLSNALRERNVREVHLVKKENGG